MKKVSKDTFLTLPEGTVYLEEQFDGQLTLAVKGKSFSPPRKVFRRDGKQNLVFFHKGQWANGPWVPAEIDNVSGTLKYHIGHPVCVLQESYIVLERLDFDLYIQTLQHFLKHYPVHSSGVVLSGEQM